MKIDLIHSKSESNYSSRKNMG